MEEMFLSIYDMDLSYFMKTIIIRSVSMKLTNNIPGNLKTKPFTKLSERVNPERYKSINGLPIRNRLILAFLLVSIVPIFIMGLISYNISRNAIMNKVAKYSGRELTQTYYNLNLALKKYSDFSTSIQLISNKDLVNSLTKLSTALTDAERFELEQQLKKTFQENFSLDSGLTVAFYPTNGKQFVYFGNDTGLEKFQGTSLYKRANTQNTVWEIYGQKIVYVRELRNINANLVLGKIAFFIDETELDNIINQPLYNEPDYSQERINELPYSIAINQKGIILLSPFKNDLGKGISSITGNRYLMKQISTSQGAITKFSGKIKNKAVLITFTKIANKGWYLLDIAPNSFLYSEMNILVLWAFFIGLLLCAIALFISIVVSLGISHPLEKVKRAMYLAESGDLSVKVTIENRDELGELGHSFNHMIDKIRGLIIDTQNAVSDVLNHSKILEDSSTQSAQTSESVSTATGEITRGMMEQTQEAEQASQKMSELAKQIETVVIKSNEVEHFSESARKMSLDSKNIVQHLMQKARDTDEISKSLIQDINELNFSADEIRNITEVITNIAEQTNLLALNAAIEAARAGDMGHGFAVVAEEVNKLASQSQVAAKTINGILKKIQNKTIASAQTASQAHKIVEEQLDAVQKAQSSFDEIIHTVDNIVQRMSEVNDNIKEINVVKENTVSSIVNISAISEQTAASAQEVSASTEEQTAIAEQVSMLAKDLLKMSDKLVDSIAKFKVHD
jgi:methyl-accepting chemotaxis protein